jgi:hypothetical protein
MLMVILMMMKAMMRNDVANDEYRYNDDGDNETDGKDW